MKSSKETSLIIVRQDKSKVFQSLHRCWPTVCARSLNNLTTNLKNSQRINSSQGDMHGKGTSCHTMRWIWNTFKRLCRPCPKAPCPYWRHACCLACHEDVFPSWI